MYCVWLSNNSRTSTNAFDPCVAHCYYRKDATFKQHVLFFSNLPYRMNICQKILWPSEFFLSFVQLGDIFSLPGRFSLNQHEHKFAIVRQNIRVTGNRCFALRSRYRRNRWRGCLTLIARLFRSSRGWCNFLQDAAWCERWRRRREGVRVALVRVGSSTGKCDCARS